jgi:predicted SprT family Zn-dependent metalloprotease
MWTVERITEVCKRYAAKVNDDFTIPVSINSRLTKTLGRVNIYRNGYGECILDSMEFSKSFLETSTDEDIEAVIGHEVAHYLVTKITHIDHQHDEYFVNMCLRIGCNNYTRSIKVERIVPEEALYKYTIYCPNCGCIGGKTRRCQLLKHITECSCKKCGSQSLFYKTNW